MAQDVWGLTLLHVLATASLLRGARPGSCSRGHRVRSARTLGVGAPEPSNLPQVMAALAAMGPLMQTALLAKAIAVAVGAPEALLPPSPRDGSAGLVCLFGAIMTSLVGVSSAVPLAHALLVQRASGKVAAQCMEDRGGAKSSGDEESGLRTPLLGKAARSGNASKAGAAEGTPEAPAVVSVVGWASG